MPYSGARSKLLAVLFLFLTSTVVMAQVAGTAALTGAVTDPTGAVVVGADVIATNLATGAKRAARTDAAGKYLITQVPPVRRGSQLCGPLGDLQSDQHAVLRHRLVESEPRGPRDLWPVQRNAGRATAHAVLSAVRLLIRPRTSAPGLITGGFSFGRLNRSRGRDGMLRQTVRTTSERHRDCAAPTSAAEHR